MYIVHIIIIVITVRHLSLHLSVCLSIRQFGILLTNGSLIFSELHDDGKLEYLNTHRARFSRKIHFCPNLCKNDPKCPQNRVEFF